jgi:Predicted phosphatase
VLIRHGEEAGKIIQIASAPMDAELTGPWFSPDYKTLFLSVQHPGEQSGSLEKLTSTWPHDADGIPKPSVVCIQGALIEKLNHLDKLV